MLPLFLMVGILGWAVPIVSRASNEEQLPDSLSGSSLQVTGTPTLTVTPTISATITPVLSLTKTSLSFQATFEELGYGEKILESPWGSTQYSFRLPDNWLVKNSSYFELEYSYFFTDLGRKGESKLELASFGEMTIYLDNRLLRTDSLDQPDLEDIRLRVDLPPELFDERPGVSHQITVVLDTSTACNLLHKAKLVIDPESTLFLDYSLFPPNLDLSDYPRPFFQRSFEPDQVRFVLPAHPFESELHAASVVAAGLGDMTDNRMVISTTTDVDWLEMVSAGQDGSEHLLVIGQPTRNQLVTWLNDNVTLPVSLQRRQMGLSSRGPASVIPGNTFSYTITATNTTPVAATSLSLIDRMPYHVNLLDCRPVCTEVSSREISWVLDSLSPGEVVSFSLTLRLTDTIQPSPQTPLLENMVVLADETAVPLNISSLTTALGHGSAEEEFVVSSSQEEYFFMQNGQPVPETDGILQEITSFWDPQKAILLVTGLNEDAIYKASRALGPGITFPDMKGPAALIREVHPSPPTTKTLAVDLTLADLGYSDQVVYGIYRQELSYWFPLPLGWQLTDNAYLRLLFAHSEAINEQNSVLTVFFNDTPLATAPLNQGNSTEGSLRVNLPNSKIRQATNNKISIQVSMQADRDQCEAVDIRQFWVSISQDSQLHLDHQVQNDNILDLDYFPLPFSAQSDLGDLLFVLPYVPTSLEQETLLQLAAALGNAASGPGFNPVISFGGRWEANMLNGYHIIAIGRPSTNPFVQRISSLLPQPFVPGTDEIEQQIGEIILRLSPDTPLGYIQEIPSPWNDRQALLVVTGTTNEGLTWAINTLLRQPWRLKGNLAMIRQGEEGTEIEVIDTRSLSPNELTLAMTTAMPELTPVATITPTSTSTPQSVADSQEAPARFTSSLNTGPVAGKGGLPIWVMVLAGITVAAVVAIFGVVIWQGRRQRE
jgi:uncharacterized repeat protein (TIGR01451 family)